MTPNFPIRNLITNTLNELREKDFAFDYSKMALEEDDDPFSNKEFILAKVEQYDSLFELFESEINQTIFAKNNIITNALFHDLKSRRQTIYPKPEFIQQEIIKWNNESYVDYEKKVLKKSLEYFANPKYNGLQHLQTYEDIIPKTLFNFSADNFKHITRTYYNYYCIEDIWNERFDANVYDRYLIFLNEQSRKFCGLIDPYIQRYDEGEFTENFKSIEGETLFDKGKKILLNNKFIVFIIFAGIIVGGIAKFGSDIDDISKKFGNLETSTAFVSKDFSSKYISFGIPDDGKCEYLIKADHIIAKIEFLGGNKIDSEITCDFIETLDKCPQKATNIYPQNFVINYALSRFKNDTIKIVYTPDAKNNPRSSLIFEGIKIGNQIVGDFTWIRDNRDPALFFTITVRTILAGIKND